LPLPVRCAIPEFQPFWVGYAHGCRRKVSGTSWRVFLCPLAIHFFTRVDGRWMLRNIFIDGNTFAHSHSVKRDPWVAGLSAG